MKVSKIPGLGRFGIFIDDLDFNNMSDDVWMEIGQLHLKNLVTIIRNTNADPLIYEHRINQWGPGNHLFSLRMFKKYGVKASKELFGKAEINGIKIDQVDKDIVENLMRINALDESGGRTTGMMRVSGKKDADGNPLGMFAEGELLWHSNESGQLAFHPAVALLGRSGVVGSATGFVTTSDWYEEQTESFRSELDEMILVHKFTPGRINPGLRYEQDIIMYGNMCPEDGAEIPLVINSPLGIKGLHYTIPTVSHIKGISIEESRKIFDYIDKTLLVDKYIYDHWYQQDNDLCLFDNSITMHRRLGGIADRVCLRIQHSYMNIEPPNVNRYFQSDYEETYRRVMSDLYSL